jgi:chromosome partitioning protein
MNARVLPVANQKGGVGKTTTALSLAAAFGRMGRKVLVVDLDPHVSASIHLQFYPERLVHTAYDIFQRGSESWSETWTRVRYSGNGLAFDFVPSHTRLSELEIDLHDRAFKGMILKEALLEISDNYDYIILDCPPHMGILLVNALVAADLLVIPIQTDFLALNGLRLLFDTMRTLNRVLPRPIEYMVLATMYDQRTSACKRVMQLLRSKMGSKMFETVIHIDTKFREACALGKVIYDIAPSSRGAKEYFQLAKEIEAA